MRAVLLSNGRRALLWAILTGLAAAAGLGACQGPRAAPPDSPSDAPAQEPLRPMASPTVALAERSFLPAQAYLDRSLRLRKYTPAQVAEIARCPVAIFPLRLLLSPEAQGHVRELRRRNPAIVLLGVHQVLSLPEVWNHSNQRKRFPLAAELYDLLAPHKTLTTTGDTAWRWPGNVMINPWSPTGFREELLRRRLDILQKHMDRYPGVVDGVFHDYLSATPFLFAGKDVKVRGQVDMDGDGKPVDTDLNERMAWRSWQVALVQGWQERFGEDFIQIANGRLPHHDPQVAGLLAGIAYEFFPTLPWKLTDAEGLRRALDHLQPGYLTPRRGRLWSLLWDTNGLNTDFCRAASALTGQLYVLTERNGWVGFDELDLASLPTGPLEQINLPGGGVEFRRDLANGTARIVLAPNGSATTSELLPTEAQSPR